MLLSKQFSTTNFSIIDAFMVASWPKKGRQKGWRPDGWRVLIDGGVTQQ